MADRIKGLKIVLGADTSELTKAIYNVNSAITKTQTNLRDINKALKIDPGNINLLKDKQTELTTAIQKTKEKIKEEEQALQALKDQGVDETSQEFKDLQLQIDLDNAALKDLEKQMKEFGSVGAQAVKAVGDHLQEVGTKIKAVGDKIAGIGQELTTKVTLPIIATGTAAVSKFAEVDKTMTLVNATMENSEAEAKQLDDAMKSAAANSTFGMNDAAQAALNFARAGLEADEAAAAMAPAMNLAAGAAGDLNTVSNGLVATINGFGDEFNQASHYADVFAVACNSSALDVNTLSESMSVAAPIFNTAGKSVEDAALMLGVMANAGIDANVAANSLKTGMARLAEPTKQAKEAMEKYGIAMDQIWNPDGSMKDMTTIQKNLNDSFKNLSEQEQMAAAGAIFGKNQMSAWLAVINTAPDDVQNLADKLSNVTGTTEEMANAMMSGFGGSIEKLKSSLDVLMVSLGEIVAKYLTPLIEKIQGAVDKFLNMDEASQNFIVKLAMIAAAIGPVLLIVGKMVAGVGGIVTTIGKITSSVSALIPIISSVGAPILAIVAAIAVLVAAFVHLYNTNDEFREKVQGSFERIKEAVSGLIERIQPALEQLKQSFSDLVTAIQPALEFIVTLIEGIVIGVVNAIEPITEAITAGIDYITNIIEAVIALFNGDFEGFFEHLKAALSSLITFWIKIIEAKIEFVKGILSAFGINIGAIFNNIKTTISNIWTAIKTAVVNTINGLVQTAVNIFNTMKNAIGNACSGIKNVVVNGFKAAISYIKSLPGQALGWGKDIISNLISGITSKISGIKDTMKNVANTIASFIHFSEPDEGPLSDFHTFMPDMMKQLAEGITRGIPQIESAMDSMTRAMVPSMGQMSNGEAAGSTTTNSVNINIYGAQGQDVNELANIVEEKITNNIVRRGVVFS